MASPENESTLVVGGNSHDLYNSETAAAAYRVRLLYDKLVSASDQIDKSLFAESFCYEPAESHPLTEGPVHGAEEFLRNAYWAAPDWEQFQFRIDQMHAGDKIVLQGYCTGIYKPSGKLICTQLLHIWSLENGLLIRLQELVDTEDLHRAIEND